MAYLPLLGSGDQLADAAWPLAADRSFVSSWDVVRRKSGLSSAALRRVP
jgi:hypothetical protein